MDKALHNAASKIRWTLLASIILSLGFGQLERVSVGSLSFYLHDPLILLLLLLQVKNIIKNLRDKVSVAIGAFILSMALSALFNLGTFRTDPELILYTARIAAYLLLYPALLNSGFRRHTKALLLLSGGIALALGYIQYFFLPDVRYLKLLGWDDHLSRITFPHLDPTFTAVMIVLFMLLAHGSKKHILVLAALPAVLLSYARSVWISLIAPILMMVKKKKTLLIIALLSIALILALPRKFGEGTNLLRTYSISSRIEWDREVLGIGVKNPILGVGNNTVPLHLNKSSDYEIHSNSANNSYIQAFATSGILGVFSLVFLLSRLFSRSKNKEAWAFMLLASVFNNVLYYPFALLWMIILDSTDSKLKRE